VTASSFRERSYISNVSTSATKTSTPLRDLPASIQIVPALVLKDQGASTLDQTIRNVSGLTQSSSSNYGFFNNYTVRGLRQRFMRDGVPDGPTTNGYARTLTDVDRVEVLKGPGSAIYGSAEPGGSINLVSKATYSKPVLNLMQSGGSFNTLRTSIDGGGPLGDQIRTRVSAAYNRKDGYRNIENRSIEILPAMTYTPSRDHTLTFNFDYRKIEQDADTYGIPFQGDNVIGDVPLETDYHTPFSNTSQTVVRGTIAHNWQVSDGVKIHTAAMLMKRDLYLLRNAGGTVTTKSDTMSARRLRQQTDDATDMIAQVEPVFSVITGPIAHTILTGLEYTRTKVFAFRNTAGLPSITNIHNPVVRETSIDSLKFVTDFDRDITVSTVGAYAQDQVTFSDQFKARVGVRYDLFDVKDIHKTDTLGDARSDGRVSAQAGLVFQPITELSIYTGVAKGALSTVTTEGARISEPESSMQYELGTKASLLEGLLQLNVAAFYVIREKFNVTIGVEQLPVGAQRTQGLELDLSGQPTREWGITANYAYYDAKITNNPADTGAIGKRPVGVPGSSASVWTAYTIGSGTLEGLGFGAGITYRGDMFFDAHNTRTIPSFFTGDATIFYRMQLLEAQVNVTNVTDKQYFRNGVNAGLLPGDRRSVQASVRVNIW
jgi:iron complex outermembrane receptor protein